jgi:hypothetical protein
MLDMKQAITSPLSNANEWIRLPAPRHSREHAPMVVAPNGQHHHHSSAAATASSNDRLIIIDNRCEQYDCQLREWSSFKLMCDPRSEHGAVIDPYTGDIIAFGGMASVLSRPLSSIERYSFQSNKWRTLTLELPYQLSKMMYGVVDGCLIICGGTSRPMEATSSCWSLDLRPSATPEWIRLPNLPEATFAGTSVVI